ncbi:LOW QUALITY PROTEIN: hypothetical protein PHMEG_00015192 [Phytophthora megakarya]|uniref:Retrotransposon gag domain-containing protein n=1 Tax=Phytophthora megakarya TaxID=4795 RepID=A0A225W1Z4_9STRA|nr:LOW QUALITY PROTEIN: hypothetical protein PHMEG_00015192 [Phytophthora megakarya]
MVGTAKNWHRQLSRTTKTKWADVLERFQTQYCGLGRSEEPLLDYLYRLNVAALRVKPKIKDGNPKARREHVDHYIETLGDPELADCLTLLRLAGVDQLKKVPCARERAKRRHRRSAFGSKVRQKVPSNAPAAPDRAMVRTIQDTGAPSQKGSRDLTGELRRIFLAAAEDKLISTGQNPDPARSRTEASEGSPIVVTQETEITKIETVVPMVVQETHRSGLLEASDRGHITDRCLYACRGCAYVHEAGECPMEEFYNQIRKWYDPTRHAELFPEQVEKMLNLNARRGVESGTSRAF